MKIGKKSVNTGYLPKQLDVLWMKCEPHIGREAGSHNSSDKRHNYRPFVVISNNSFNADRIVETYPVTTSKYLPKSFLPYSLKLRTRYHNAHGRIIMTQILGRDSIARDAVLIDRITTKEWEKIRPFIKDTFPSNY